MRSSITRIHQILVTESNQNAFGGEYSTYGAAEDVYKNLIGKPRGKIPVGKPKRI
jgi:hypothetical protein